MSNVIQFPRAEHREWKDIQASIDASLEALGASESAHAKVTSAVRSAWDMLVAAAPISDQVQLQLPSDIGSELQAQIHGALAASIRELLAKHDRKVAAAVLEERFIWEVEALKRDGWL